MIAVIMQKSIRPIARLTLLAFIFNALLPFFAIYNVSSQAATVKEMSSLLGEKVLICSDAGFKWVKWDDLQKAGSKHKPASYPCAICYLAAHALKDFTVAGEIGFVDRFEVTAVRHTVSDHRLFSRLKSPFASRAPPIFS